MKVTRLYVYPIKALRGIALQSAELGAQGIKHDRCFALFKELENGELKKIQLSEVPECSLFEQQIDRSMVVVRYQRPNDSRQPGPELPQMPLNVPLHPKTDNLQTITVDLHGSSARVYRMGDQFDRWFSACFGFQAILAYIGDGKRPVLGSALLPRSMQQQSWISGINSYVMGAPKVEAQDSAWLTFTDVAPLLVATESSLRNVCGRISNDQAVEMYKFRPNIVVDGEDEWAEDFWAELTLNDRHRLFLTGNCVRCISLNVDYETGRPATGEMGTVLKKLMKDRRVDKGAKWSPVFGRYAFLASNGFEVSVGDQVEVSGRLKERSVWDWPGL